jgi:hypothetical protein
MKKILIKIINLMVRILLGLKKIDKKNCFAVVYLFDFHVIFFSQFSIVYE